MLFKPNHAQRSKVLLPEGLKNPFVGLSQLKTCEQVISKSFPSEAIASSALFSAIYIQYHTK
jgi:hypothetical protein